METTVHNSKGELSKYGFCCGYQQNETNGDNYKRMYFSHSIYVVSSKIDNNFKTEYFSKLSEARKHFNKITL